MVKNKNAYTLIELIVVIGIASIVFGMVLASFDSFGSDEKLDQEAQMMKSAIEEVVKKVSADEMSMALCDSKKNNFYDKKYIFSVSGTTRNLYFYYKCDEDATSWESELIYSNKLDSSFTYSCTPPTTPSCSFGFTKKTPMSGTITISSGDLSKKINFSYPGNVSIMD